ncbi:MAG: hypothetical protein KJ566_03315 [Nanoarchaeota archaeon]|nr:hypothetical protein [Nanoarchaeota archaeon]
MINKETPTRLVVLDLEGKLLGYKADSFWSLTEDSKYSKLHPFKDTKPKGNLVNNLLYFFNRIPSSKYRERHPNGLIVSVQDVSEQNFGEELLRYKVLKKGNKYVIRK